MNGANGYPLALAVLCAGIGGWIWLHARREDGKGALPSSTARAISLCAALAAAFSVVGIPPWRDALAKVFGTGPGMVALVLIVLFGLGFFVIDHIKHHHAVRSTAFGIVGATAGVLAWAMAPELGKRGAKLGPKTAAAMGLAQHQIQTGQAARAVTDAAAMLILFLAVVAFIVLIAVMRAHHKSNPFAASRNFGELKAITAGSAKALPGGMGGGPGGGMGATPGGRDSKPKKPGILTRLFGKKD